METTSPESGDGLPFADAPTVSQSLQQLEEELSGLQSAIVHIEKSQEAASKAADAATDVTASAADVASASQALVGRIGEIDFPDHFETLETTISDTVSGLRSDTSELTQEVSGLKQAQGSTAESVGSLGTQVERLSDQVREVRQELRSVTTELQKNREQAGTDHKAHQEEIARLKTITMVATGLILLVVLAGSML